jgi:hypothetical protein
MRRISDRKIAAAVLAGSLAFVASCASPKQQAPAPVHVQQQADPCGRYESLTDYSRCRLFTSADGWRFIPEIGRNAGLDTQIRCAPARWDLNAYAGCIGGTPLVIALAVAPDAATAGRGGGLSRVDPIAPTVAFARPAPDSGSLEDLDPVWRDRDLTPAVTSIVPRAPTAPAPAITSIVPNAPSVTTPPDRPAYGSPLCAENNSCYGDISALTGRPKTVHVSGYYRKDGTYVRGHYRSRPRR